MKQYLKDKIENDSVISLIKPYIKGYKAYLVGGFIRDLFLVHDSFDRDLIIEDIDVKDFSEKLAKEIKGYFIELDCENKIYRIVLQDKKNYVDISSPLENDLNTDILRRDLTINAVVYDFKNSEFIDPAGGIKDLENKVIRGISNQNFIDDPLRFLRIFRFFSRLGFEIESKLLDFTKENADKIKYPAKERVNVELMKLFEGGYAHQALIKMDNAGLLENIFDIVNELKKVPPNLHHHLDLFEHSIETVRQIQKYFENASDEVKLHLQDKLFGNCSKFAYLKLAAFLHDIGKPSTWTIEEDTLKHRFIKHDDIGSKIAVAILKELKFSKKQISYVQKMIKYHIYPSSIVSQEEVSEKAQMRLFRKMGDDTIDIILLAVADRLSALGPDIEPEIIFKNINSLNELLLKYLNTRDSIKPLEKLLDGHEIMQITGLEASIQLGYIVNQLKEAQISGDVNSKDEAIEFIKQLAVDNI